jgi:hypothetical protein
MPVRTRPLLLLIPLLLTASLALAAPPAPEAPQALGVAAAMAQPLATLFAAAPSCLGADALLSSPEPQSAATQLCGGCSDAACVGKAPNSVCGSGLRCIAGGPTCSAAERFRCRCLII